jgi:hypothetical protein
MVAQAIGQPAGIDCTTIRSVMTDGIGQLRKRMASMMDLRMINQLLEWDQQTMMPPLGVSSRAEALATLQRIRHEMLVSDETGRLLDAAAAELDGQSEQSDDAALVRVTRRRWEKARRVPSDLAAEIARATSVGHKAWISARANSDYDAFVPFLKHNLELARRYVDCFDEFDCAYDVLLDDYEPGTRTTEVAGLFAELKSALTPMIATLAAHPERADDSVLHGRFETEKQRQLTDEVIRRMGFDRAAWRCSARRSASASRWHCTSPKADCGRTWSAVAASSATCWRPRSRGYSATRSARWIPTRSIALSTACSPRLSGSRPTRPPTVFTSCCGSSSSRS